MKIKKSVLILITSAICLVNAVAQQNDFVKLCGKMAKVNIVRGDFVLKQHSSKTDKTINSSGKYTISSKDGMIWFTKDPIESVMAVTKTYMLQEMKGRQRKFDGSKNPTFSYMANAISSLFTGNYEEIENSFNVKCELISDPTANYEIKLTPKDTTIASYITEITIRVLDGKDCNITRIIMKQFNGDSSEYELKNQVLTDKLNVDEAKYFEK